MPTRIVVYASTGGNSQAKVEAEVVMKLNAEKAGNNFLVHLDTSRALPSFAAVDVEKFRGLDDQSRVYLFGHIDWKNRLMGDQKTTRSGTWVAKAFDCMPFIDRVSILGCRAAAALGADSSKDQLFQQSLKSFAGDFHGNLKGRSDVYARIYDVKILDTGKRQTLIDGSKAEDEATPTSRRPGSKIRYTWLKGLQVHYWADR